MDKLELIDKSSYVFDEYNGVFSIYKNEWCECYLSDNGYTSIKLKCIDGKRRNFQFHRVMCYIFNPIPQKYQDIPLENLEIDHIIPLKNGGTNDLSNLKWCTRKENHNNPLTRKNKSKALTNRKDQSKRVDQIDPKTGDVIASFPSAKEAARKLGFNQSSISNCCNGGYFYKKRNKWINIKQYNGYIWKCPIL